MSVMATTDINRVPSETATIATSDEKPERTSLVELRNGKIVIKQKILSFEKMSETLQEIVQFRAMLEERIERKDPPLTAIPDEHLPLIAKLTQESDKTLTALSKHIQHELLPAQDEDDEEGCKEIQAVLPTETIEKAIKGIAMRVNYGLDISRIHQAPLGGKIPVAWQVWRWEVKDDYREWLPKTSREKALVRLVERRQAVDDVLALFHSLPETDKAAILAGNSKIATTNAKVTAAILATIPARPVHDGSNGNTTSTPAVTITAPGTPSSAFKRKASDTGDENSHEQQSEEAGSSASGPKPVGRPKKPVDPEKAAKEKEKMEKKLAKAEKEKKDKEAQSRSRNLMASFFGKSKPAAASSSESTTNASPTAVPAQNTPASVPDFEKTFKPFLLKKGATLAPTNWFTEVRLGKTCKGKEKQNDVIVIDDDEDDEKAVKSQTMFIQDEDIQMFDASEWKGSRNLELGQMTAEERLRDSLHSLHPRLRPPLLPFPPRRHPTLKSRHPYVVRNIMHQLTEAEVAGEDDSVVRALLSTLRDRTKIPAKVLIFHEDTRPGYFGTWTRNSREVGPRTPFARDVVSIDYAVDSEAEWEDEEDGDVLDDAEEEGEDDGAGTEDVDSDLDSWLVDDDEPVEPGTPIDERLGSPDFPPLPPPKRKSKTDDETKKATSKKRRVVEPLVQFEKGPCWENTIGECTWEPFKAMRIQLFNDTPYPIDPFKFVAAPVEHVPTMPVVATSKGIHQTPAGEFAVPALPAHVAASNGQPTDGAVPASSAPKRPPPAPKTAFPEASMPVLFAKIKELNTGSLAVIVESVYKELNTVIKKNAIEAKIREIGEKSKDGGGGKVWAVKPEVKALYGLA